MLRFRNVRRFTPAIMSRRVHRGAPPPPFQNLRWRRGDRMKKAKIIPSSWELPNIFHGRLGEAAGRQRAMVHDGHLLLILHDVPEPGVPERVAVLFWRNPQGVWRSS